MTVGEKIRWLREERGLNQTQLGAQLHMTQRKISYMECGRYEPSISDLVDLCLFFKVSADFLIGIPPGMPFPGNDKANWR